MDARGFDVNQIADILEISKNEIKMILISNK